MRHAVAPAGTRSYPGALEHLRERIEQAARALIGRDRLLVIAVDAADNATFVARETGDKSFLPQLWHMALPDNVRLVVSSRTHRVAELSAPENVSRVLLQGFDLAASSNSTTSVRWGE